MLSLEGVSKTYRVGTFGGRELVAVRDVNLEVAPGEVITFDGTDIAGFKGKGLRAYYAQVQGVFQDPFSSYNPVFKAERALELLRQTYFAGVDGRQWRDKVEAALEG